MNKKGLAVVLMCILGIVFAFVFINFVSAANSASSGSSENAVAKVSGVVDFRGLKYFVYDSGKRTGVYINGDKSIYLQKPSVGGIFTDYFFPDTKLGIVSADPAGNFILLDSSFKDLIGGKLFMQIDGREIDADGKVGEQTESVELTINTDGNEISTGIIADGRGYLRPKNNLKETVGTIDKAGKISIYNPSTYNAATKTSLGKIVSQIQNTRATRGVITDLTKVSNDPYVSRSANARTAAASTTQPTTIMGRIGQAAGNLIDSIGNGVRRVISPGTGSSRTGTGTTRTGTPSTPRTGTPSPGTRPSPTPKPTPTPTPTPKPTPKPINHTAPAQHPGLGKPDVIPNVDCSRGDDQNHPGAAASLTCSCDTTIDYVKANGECLMEALKTLPPAYTTFNCQKPNGKSTLKMVWVAGDKQCCEKDDDCSGSDPYLACNTDTGQCEEHKPCHK